MEFSEVGWVPISTVEVCQKILEITRLRNLLITLS